MHERWNNVCIASIFYAKLCMQRLFIFWVWFAKNLLLSQSDIFGAFLCTEIARNIANLGLRIENVNFIYVW